MAQISPEDKIKVKELRSYVSDLITPIYDTDFNLLRWLQGHNYDLRQVVPKLRHHLRVRQCHWQLDHLPEERNRIQEACWVWGLMGDSGKDDNTLIYVDQSGKEDVNGYTRAFCGTQLLHGKMLDYERMLRALMNHEAKTGKQASIQYILDLDGLKMDSYLLEVITGPLKSLANVMSDHYAEMFRHIVLVNPPSFIYYFWCLVKPLVPEKTRKKVVILGSNWKEEILKFASPNVLPSFWNSEFSGHLKKVEKIPQFMYGNVPKMEAQKLSTIFISAGKSQLITVHVGKENTKLRFYVYAYNDFSFGLFYTENPEQTDVEKMEMVGPQLNRIGGPITVPDTQQIKCKKAGYYKAWFSNEHAWWNSLKVDYCLEIET